MGNDTKVDLIVDYVKYLRKRFFTTATNHKQVMDKLKKEDNLTKSFFWMSDILTVEEYDMSEEAISSDESIIDYVNTIKRIFNVFFITDNKYPTNESGSHTHIKDSVNIFTVEQFYNLACSDREFMDFMTKLKEARC